MAQASASDPVLAVGGDIACDIGTSPTATSCQQAATSDVVMGMGADAVLPLGDEQYADATAAAFAQMYDPTWGRAKSISRPVVGNHEYQTPGATGYYGYFGNLAGDPAKGYYSWDIGAWHLIALNSNCRASAQIGCAAGTPQEKWLRADLNANAGKCLLAYWHHPRFTSAGAGSNSVYQTFWEDLYAAGADLVLNGHGHAYEVFAPQSPTGVADPNGIREIVVGTGGVGFSSFTTALPNEEARQNNTFGVMKLNLHASSYDWRFLPIAGKSWTNSGSGTCHNAAPVAPTGLRVTSASASQVALAWTASTSSGVTGYRVYRNGSTTPLNGTLVTGATYTDSTVTAGTSYTYTVTAVDGSGRESPPSNSVTAVASATPVASFTASPSSGTAPLTVQFSDTSTGSPTSWAWDFGDGGTSTEQNPTHTYTAEGTFTVSLTATNAAGSSAPPATSTVTVSPAGGGTGAITMGAATSATEATGTAGVTVARPAGVINGDVLVAEINADLNPSMNRAPAGWSTVISPLSIGTTARVFVYYHVVTDATAEPASYTWRLSAARKWNAGITDYHGVNTTTPFDTAAQTATTTTSTATLSVPGVTTATDGALVIGGVGLNSTSATVTPPASWTESFDVAGGQVAEMAATARPTAGATGTAQWTVSKSISGAAGWLRALRPA